MTSTTRALFYDIVLKGAYQIKGMARWDDVLSRQDAQAIHAYLAKEARSLAAERTAASPIQ